jgi:predicted PurR-regulated permease PerM
MTEMEAAHPPDTGLVPGWLQRLAAIGWRLLAAVVLGVVSIRIAVLLSTVTASVLVAAIIAATFAPFVLALRDRGWSRIKAAAAVFLAAAVVIVATLIIIGLAFLPYAAQVVEDLSAGIETLKSLMAQYTIPPEVADTIDHATKGLQAWLSASASEIATNIGTVATVGLLATFLTFFFLMDGDKAWVWGLSSANEWRREAIMTSGHIALERVGGYLRGTAVLAAIDGLAEGLFLFVLGVPHALPLAVIVFFGRFIPYIGGLVTTILLLVVTLAAQGTTAALILLVLIGILDVIQGKFLAPAIYQKTVHIHPAIVLVALPAGAALAGIIGLFVAIPMVAFALAIVGALISVLGVEPTGMSSANPLVPVWLDRLGQWSWRLLVSLGLLGAGIFAAIQIPIVVLPLVLGIVLASTLAPLSNRFEARGWSKGRASLVATVGASLGVIVIVTLTVVSLAGPASDIVANATTGAQTSNDSVGGVAGPLVSLVQTFGSGVLVTIAGVLSSLAGLVVVVFLAVLLTFYFLRDGDAFWDAFLARVEPGRRSHVDAAGTRAVNVLGGYMIGTGAISIFGAATQFLIMTVLGIPLALPLAVLAIFGGFIPYIGSLITTGLAFLVTVATGTPQDIVIMGLFTIVFNIVQGNIVAPIVYSRVVSLHPAVVLVAIPAGNAIAGIVGMFLVVPFLGVVAAVWRTVLRVLDTEPMEILDDGSSVTEVGGETGRTTTQATIATP